MKYFTKKILPPVFFIFFTLTQTALANEIESLDNLKQLAYTFITSKSNISADEKIEVNLSPSAKQLALKKCHDPIQIQYPNNQDRENLSTLEMTCTEQNGWHVFIPLEIKTLAKVIVAKQPIPANEVIKSDMLDITELNKNQLFNGFFKDTNQVVDKIAAVTITPGTVLTRKNIKQAVLIHKNQQVEIQAVAGNIMVKAKGIAKSDGILNEIISVYNPSSKKLLDAAVVSNTTVIVS